MSLIELNSIKAINLRKENNDRRHYRIFNEHIFAMNIAIENAFY